MATPNKVTEEVKREILQLTAEGMKPDQVAEICGVHRATVYRVIKTADFVWGLSWVKTFTDYPKITSSNLAIISDLHLPYIHIPFTLYFMDIAREHGCKELLIAGDMFDQAMFSVFKSSLKSTWEQESKGVEKCLLMLLEQFDKITIIMGNHDARLLRLLNYELQFTDVVCMVMQDARLHISQRPMAMINPGPEQWMVSHPKSYRQISGQVGKDMAAKHLCHQVITHGHLTCHTFDRSGRFHCIDIGGLVHYEKCEYVMQQLTTHPKWVNGFLLLLDNEPLLFTGLDKGFLKGGE